MKVIWFKRAIWDLKSAKDYITQDNPKAAQKIVRRIRDKVSLLSEQPNIGRLGRVPNTKELIVDKTSFILPYRVRDNHIEILRVLHTSRQWPKKMSEAILSAVSERNRPRNEPGRAEQRNSKANSPEDEIKKRPRKIPRRSARNP